MIIPVYIPDWQIGDGDIAPPAIGQLLDHVLVLETPDVNPHGFYGCFGTEITLTCVAVPRPDHPGGELGTFPTELECEGFSVFWAAPRRVAGHLTVTGILSATDYGAAPEGFPRVQGTIVALTESSLIYATENPEGTSWVPAPGEPQILRPLGSYPPPAAPASSGPSPHKKVTGCVVDVDTSVTDEPAVAARARFDGLIKVRLFPDYAGTALWLHDPLSYHDSALSPSLVAALQEWEASYYSSLTADDEWVSPEAAATFTFTGNSLAQKLAEELGEMFSVEFHSYEHGAQRRMFTSGVPAANPAAASALLALVAAAAAEKARLEAFSALPGTGWFAYSPLSETTFPPGVDPGTAGGPAEPPRPPEQ
ncbi:MULTISPECIES: hypothetical protein [Arthrobacter]|uniref:hypothetical protein n=1 Tax=Arthrobacter TaxID=1663 RepID=UPI0028F70F1C|nr:hypothetical protein [Arthrobacter sp. lap29]